MQSIRGALLLLTVCLCASSIRAKPSFDIFKDIWADLEDGGRSIIEGLRTATQDGANFGKDLVINRLNSKKEFFDDITSLGAKLSDALSASLSLSLSTLSETLNESINNFTEKVASERNLVKKRALSNGLATLKELRSVALKMESDLSDINQSLGERVNEQLNETYNEILQWRDEQLARVDDETAGAGLAEAERRASQFLSGFIDDMQSVVEELEIRKSLFEQELNDKVSAYSAYLGDLIEAMDSCSRLASLQCRLRIEEAVENLEGGRDELEALLEAGKDMIERGVRDSGTLASVLEKIRLSKLDFERDLDEIIERYRESSPAPYPSQADEGSAADSESFPDDEPEDASDEIFSRLSDSSRRLAAKLFNSTRGGIDFKDILENLYDSETQVLQDVTQLAKDLSVAVSELMISGLGQLTDVLNKTILDLEEEANQRQGLGNDTALNLGLKYLRKLNSTASSLRLSLIEISHNLADELSDKVNATLNELLEWKDVQLQLVDNGSDGAGVAEAADLIGRILQSYTDDFLEALRPLEQSKSVFEEHLLQVSLLSYKKYANLLRFEFSFNLSDSQSGQHRGNIAIYSLQLQRGSDTLQSLLQKSQDVARASDAASKRVGQLLQQLARDKLDAERQIAEIIEGNAGETSEATYSPLGRLAGVFSRSKREAGNESENTSSVISSKLTESLTESNTVLDKNITELADQIDSLNNPTKKTALTTGLDALKTLQSAAANLSTLLADINTQLGDNTSTTISEALTLLSEWETTQLKRLSENSNARGKRQGKDSIKLVRERNARNLESTLSTFELQVSQFESAVKDKISANNRTARTMIDVMTKCLNESMSVGRCSTKITQLAVGLNNSPNDLNAVEKKSTSLLKAGANAAANVEYLLEKIEADKSKCESDIDTIIAMNPGTTSTTAKATNSSSEADGENASSDEADDTQDGS